MHAESGLLFPYFQSSPPHVQRFEDFYRFQKPSASMSDLAEPSSMSDYGLGSDGDLFKAPEPIMEEPATDINPMTADYGIGREGDLFKAPEPIMEEPVTDVDPMIAALSMISCGEEAISRHSLEVAESIQNEELLREVLYECEKDLLAKAAIEMPQSVVLKGNLSCSTMGEPVQKSISSGCLSSIDLGSVYGMRRAFSEGDIKTLGNGQVNIIHEWQKCDSVERLQKLSRYRNKKKNRNFGRKIKYACRKALADSQPRIRGRFAKTEEAEVPRRRRG